MVGYDLEMLRPTLTHVGMRSKQDTYTWQTGKVVDFDEDGKQHQIGFNSGQILWFNLNKKMFVRQLLVRSLTVFGYVGALQLKQRNSVVRIAGSITLKLVA